MTSPTSLLVRTSSLTAWTSRVLASAGLASVGGQPALLLPAGLDDGEASEVFPAEGLPAEALSADALSAEAGSVEAWFGGDS